MHSFVSLAYVEKLGNTSKALDVIYCIVISSCDIMYSCQRLRSYLIHIIDKELIINLIILNIQDFDIIMGMDQLSKYHAFIYYNKKLVVF